MKGRSIDNQFIENLIQNADLPRIVGERIALKKSGKNYSGLCPFHQEKTPSFSVDASKNLFHCFGCQVGGNAVQFLMRLDSLDFVAAIERLAELEGVQVVYKEGASNRKSDEQNHYRAVLKHAVEFYKEQLRIDKSGVIGYLKERGVDTETIKEYELGYAPSGNLLWNSLQENQELCKAALELGLVKRDENNRAYDVFRSRVMFPIHNQRRQTLGFGGRILSQGQAAKYINSTDSVIFHKGEEFYGLPQALACKGDTIALVEGYMDVLPFCSQRRVVACLGTAFTEEHSKRLFCYTDKIVFAFDGDDAGRKAAGRAVFNSLPFINDSKDLALLFLDSGEDPNSLLLKEGLQAWDSLKQTSMDQFLLHDIHAAQDTGEKSKAVKALTENLARMPSSHRKALLLKEVENMLGIKVSIPELQERSPKRRATRPKETPIIEGPPTFLANTSSILLNRRELATRIKAHWQEEFEAFKSADAKEKDTRIMQVIGILDAAEMEKEYFYGYLCAKGIVIPREEILISQDEEGILKDIGDFLLKAYSEQLSYAIANNKIEKSSSIKKHIRAIKDKQKKWYN